MRPLGSASAVACQATGGAARAREHVALVVLDPVLAAGDQALECLPRRRRGPRAGPPASIQFAPTSSPRGSSSSRGRGGSAARRCRRRKGSPAARWRRRGRTERGRARRAARSRRSRPRRCCVALAGVDEHRRPAGDLAPARDLGDGQLAAQRRAVAAADAHHRAPGPRGLAGRRAEHVLEAAAERVVGGPAGDLLERRVDVQQRRVGVARVGQATATPRASSMLVPTGTRGRTAAAGGTVERLRCTWSRLSERRNGAPRGRLPTPQARRGPRARPRTTMPSSRRLANVRISRRAASLSPSIVAAKRRMPAASAASASACVSAVPRPWSCHGSPTTIAISAVPGRSGRRTQRARPRRAGPDRPPAPPRARRG